MRAPCGTTPTHWDGEDEKHEESSFGKDVSSRTCALLGALPSGLTILNSWHFEHARALLIQTSQIRAFMTTKGHTRIFLA